MRDEGSVKFLRDTGGRRKTSTKPEREQSLDGLLPFANESRRRRMPPPPEDYYRIVSRVFASLHRGSNRASGPQISPLAGGGVTRNRPERFPTKPSRVAKMHAHHSPRITPTSGPHAIHESSGRESFASRFFAARFFVRGRPLRPNGHRLSRIVIARYFVSIRKRYAFLRGLCHYDFDPGNCRCFRAISRATLPAAVRANSRQVRSKICENSKYIQIVCLVAQLRMLCNDALTRGCTVCSLN